jgi:hypothetical protein
MGLNQYAQASMMKQKMGAAEQEKQMRAMQLAQMQAEQGFRENLGKAMGPAVPPSQTFAPGDMETPSQFTPGSPATLDTRSPFYAKAAQLDPMKALSAQQAFSSMGQKQLVHAKEGESVLQFDPSSGGLKTLYQSPKQKKYHYQDLGDKVGVFDETGQKVGEFPKSMGPGEKERLGVELSRLGLERARFADETGQGLGAPRPGNAPMQPAGGMAGLSPKDQRAVARTGAEEQAKIGATASMALPDVIAKAQDAVTVMDKMLKHPGLETSVGAKGPTGMLANVNPQLAPGTHAADFMTLSAQLQGKAFLQAYETLKGGGQITEVEGKKGTEAIARLSTAQSEAEYRAALNDFKNVIKAGIQRAKSKAAGFQPAPVQAQPDPLGIR